MTNREIAEAAGVSLQTVNRMKKRPGWPGGDDLEKIVLFIKSTKGRAGRPKKGEEKTISRDAMDEITRLNLEYKRSQIEKNNTSTHEYQLRILRGHRERVVKGCSESMAILFKAISSLDLDIDQLKIIKSASIEAKEHLKKVATDE